MAEKTRKTRKTKPTWGGRRAGAGRKKGTKMVEDPISEHLSFRVRKDTLQRVRALRELTKNDTMPFNRMFEAWVEDMARDYGINCGERT